MVNELGPGVLASEPGASGFQLSGEDSWIWRSTSKP